MGYVISANGKTMLLAAHPDLRKVMDRAIQITPIDFRVIETIRTVERQRELVRKGASKTMNSRHLTGHAVDIVPIVDGKVSWAWPHYYPLAKAVKQAAKELGVPIEWGGDWKSFKDGPHWQLPFSKYPANTMWRGLVERNVVAKAEADAIQAEPQYTSETTQAAQNKAVAAAGTSTATGVALAGEPVADAVTMVTQQQGELTSGDWVRIAVAVAIIGLGLWFAYRKLKD